MTTSKLLPNCTRRVSPTGALFLAAVAILGACNSNRDVGTEANEFIQGGTTQITDVKPVASFLPQPSLLQPGGTDQPALVYRNPKTDFKTYTQIMLDPVEIWAGPNSALQSVPQDQRTDLANTFHSDLYDALSAHCRMVTQPTPATLRLRLAITDETQPDTTLNTVATYAPYAGTAYGIVSRAFNKGVGYFSGTATAEGYAKDGKTGELVWEAVDKRGGTTAVVEN
ncbi:MAG TPA: DUF3313 domain-containing protein, partial [Stellaceae bacterium]|nr:DUF3313 domain-containing protein [Stellaceae bacterium]